MVNQTYQTMKKFFSQLFNDNNTINEKSVVGFISFIMMVATMILDLATGWMGKELLINEFIFNGFLLITLGSFGISSFDKWVNKKNIKEKESITEE
jgi:ABC-type uncharacterized transport system permease subunit